MAYSASLDPFPFAIENAPDASYVGDGTARPVGLTLQELLRLWHNQVLRFDASVSADVTQSPPLSPPSYPISSYCRGIITPYTECVLKKGWDLDTRVFVNTFPVHGESAMNAYLPTHIGRVDFSGYTDWGEPAPASEFETSQPDLFPHQPISNVKGGWTLDWNSTEFELGISLGHTYKHDGLFYPNIAGIIKANFGEWSESCVISTTQQFYAGSWKMGVPHGVGSLLGKPLQLYRDSDPATPVPTSFQFDIEVAAYHPHDPGDTAPYPGKVGSGPMYDTTTGATLRDPFAIGMKPDGSFFNPNYVAP